MKKEIFGKRIHLVLKLGSFRKLGRKAFRYLVCLQVFILLVISTNFGKSDLLGESITAEVRQSIENKANFEKWFSILEERIKVNDEKTNNRFSDLHFWISILSGMLLGASVLLYFNSRAVAREQAREEFEKEYESFKFKLESIAENKLAEINHLRIEAERELALIHEASIFVKRRKKKN